MAKRKSTKGQTTIYKTHRRPWPLNLKLFHGFQPHASYMQLCPSMSPWTEERQSGGKGRDYSFPTWFELFVLAWRYKTINQPIKYAGIHHNPESRSKLITRSIWFDTSKEPINHSIRLDNLKYLIDQSIKSDISEKKQSTNISDQLSLNNQSIDISDT